MTPITESSLQAVAHFVHAYPEVCDHVVDLPYRLCSPAAQDQRNIRLWRDESGEVIAFSIIQIPFSVIDWAVLPTYEHLAAQIMDWSLTRLSEFAVERGSEFGFWIGGSSAEDQTILQSGFVLDDWTMLHLSQPLSRTFEIPTIPDGYRIRALAGESEVDAYVALHRAAFESRNMSSDWRSRTLLHPAYTPELDIVVENDEGTLVAFCIGWISEVNGVRTGQIEPLGVLPAEHRHGLGRAVLLTALRGMQALGCKTALVDAGSYNPPSQALYKSVGFAEQSTTFEYFRSF